MARSFCFVWGSPCFFLREAIVHGIIFLPYCVLARAQMKHAANLANLERQVSSYSIRHADCYCCSNSHVHPDTGACLPCDRELVCTSIAHWYGGAGDRDQGLANFDQLVRSMCAGCITDRLGMCGIPYKWVLCVTIWRLLGQSVDWLYTYNGSNVSWLHFMTAMFYSFDTLLLREPMLIGIVSFAGQRVISITRKRPCACGLSFLFLIPALAGWFCNQLFAGLAFQFVIFRVFPSWSDFNQFGLYLVLIGFESSLVWLMYSRRRGPDRMSSPSTTVEIELVS